MVWTYTIVSVLAVSLISLIGIFTLSISRKKLYSCLIYLVSLAAGTLLGDAFIHLLPEAFENENKTAISVYLLSGILLFFVMEKIIHWRHCHLEATEEHQHPITYAVLVGDTIHNFIDGMIIAAGFLVSVPVGMATASAVILHEIPQEIGDFGSLVYGGFSSKKAILFNFLSGLVAILGALLVLCVGKEIDGLTTFLVPFAAGGFIYIASSDLIPELHKHKELKTAIFQTVAFISGIGIMLAMLCME